MRRCKAKCGQALKPAAQCEDLLSKKGYCSIECLAEHTRAKRIELARKAERKTMKEAKAKLKSRGDYAREAQTAFNAYIRARDEGNLCISCQKPPKKKNAGHYRSVGSSPELRYEPLNCYLQCEHCNTYLSGNIMWYRRNLFLKIGAEKLEWLEGPHKPKKYTIEDLKNIKTKYKTKLKEVTQ